MCSPGSTGSAANGCLVPIGRCCTRRCGERSTDCSTRAWPEMGPHAHRPIPVGRSGRPAGAGPGRFSARTSARFAGGWTRCSAWSGWFPFHPRPKTGCGRALDRRRSFGARGRRAYPAGGVRAHPPRSARLLPRQPGGHGEDVYQHRYLSAAHHPGRDGESFASAKQMVYVFVYRADEDLATSAGHHIDRHMDRHTAKTLCLSMVGLSIADRPQILRGGRTECRILRTGWSGRSSPRSSPRPPPFLIRSGLEGIDSDYATLVRTTVILMVLGALVYATGKWQNPTTVPGPGVALSHSFGSGYGSELGLLFSGAQGGRGVEGDGCR